MGYGRIKKNCFRERAGTIRTFNQSPTKSRNHAQKRRFSRGCPGAGANKKNCDMQKQLGAAAFDTPCELVKRSNGMLTSYDQFCCSNKAKVSFTTSATQS